MEGSRDRPEQGRRFNRRPLLTVASDERLAQEVQLGNEAAFEVIYRRHVRPLLALCQHILGSRDEAEEALQQAFASAWSDLQRPDRPAPEALKPWLFAIARHRCLSMLRLRRPSTVELDELPSTAGLSEEVGRRADLRALLADVHDLPEEQKTALVLAELGGLSHGDIADVLGRQTPGVKMLIFQARTTLGAWREAREAPCTEIRQQLSVLHGGSLRRRPLRRHLQSCADCRAFRAELRTQQRGLAIVLPVLPSLGLKEGVLAAVGLGSASSAGAAGGGLLGAGAAVGLGAPALVPLGSATVAALATVGALAGGPGALGKDADPDRPSRIRAEARTADAGGAAADASSPSTPPGGAGGAAAPFAGPGGDGAGGGEGPSGSGHAGPGPGSIPARHTPLGNAPSSTPLGGTAQGAGHASDPGRGGPGAGAGQSHESVSDAEADTEADEKSAEAESEAAGTISKADEEADREIARANEDEAKEIADADREAEGGGRDAQPRAEEEKAKAREEREMGVSEAEEKRAEPRRELDEKFADAIEERDWKVAPAPEERDRRDRRRRREAD